MINIIMAEKLFLHVCRAYQAELQSVLQKERIADIGKMIYPQVCVHSDERDAILTESFNDSQESDNHIYISDYCCLFCPSEKKRFPDSTNKPELVCNSMQILLNHELLTHFSADGGFLLSPGWLANWRENLNKWNLDQTSAKTYFSEIATRLVLLDTGIDINSADLLKELSIFLDLPSQTIPIGLDHFRNEVISKVSAWKNKFEMDQVVATLNEASEQMANYGLTFDLASNLTRIMNEPDAITEINHIFQMLFSPKETSYISILNDQYNISIVNLEQADKIKSLLDWAMNTTDSSKMNEAEDGFYIRISFQSETLGVAEIRNVALPYYCDKYLNMSLVLAPLFGLTISRARAYQKIKEDEAKLKELASTDSLTGLANRRHFLELAEIEFSRAKRYSSPLSLIMLDIDHFKLINDTYGHAVGDDVLTIFSHLLTSSLRKSDIPARIGGDEFIILLPETSLEKATLLGERLCSSFAKKPIQSGSTSITFTSSMGVAEMDISCTKLDEFIHHGDQALYKAKRNGRNQVYAWPKQK